MRPRPIRFPSRRASMASLFAIGVLAGACASSSGDAESVAAAGRRVETLNVGSNQGGALSAVEIETGSSVVDRVVPTRPQDAWAALPQAFLTLEIEASTVDRPSLSMGNERFVASRIEGRSLSSYIDCGTTFGRARADQFRVTMQVLVQLAPAPGGGTRVRTMLDAYAEPRDVAGNSYHCTSTGALERRVAELLTPPGA